MEPVNKSKLKDAILKTLIEKGEYTSVLSHMSGEEKEEKESKKTERLNKLIEPISEFAELMTANTKGVLMENMDKKLSKSTREALAELAKQVNGAIDTLQEELDKTISVTKGELTREHQQRLSDAKTQLEKQLFDLAIDIVNKKADSLLPELEASNKLTESEIDDIIDATALTVESQIVSIIGEYITEQGITVSQITDFKNEVQKLIPQVDFSSARINWSQIMGAPSQGGTNTNIVRQLIAEALADFSGGASAFTDLTDTPSSYTGQGGKVVAVNVGEDALEFIAASGVGTVTSVAVSGSDGIEVDSGSPVTAAGTIALGLNKANTLTFLNVADGAQVNAIDSVTDTSEIDLAITAKALSASIVAGSIDETKLDASVNASLGLADSSVQPGDALTTLSGDLPFSQLAQISAHSVLGRAGAGTGDVAGITMGNDTILGRSGSGDVDDLSATQVRTLINVENGADVTDTANVTAAGALMDSELADITAIKTLQAPDNTTISTAAATVLDDATVADMVNTLGGATSTGTGGLARATSPTFVTPILGTPTSGTLTNCTGLPLSGVVDSTSEALGVGTLEVGHATDTTISRVSAGVIAVEGVTVPTISSTSTLTNKTLTAPVLTGTTTADRIDYDRAVGAVNAIGNLGATETIDWSTHTHFTGNLDSNITFTYSNNASGQSITLYLTYSGAQRTITWPTTTWLDNDAGTAPTAPAASGNVLVVTLQDIGGTIYGSATGNYAVYA